MKKLLAHITALLFLSAMFGLFTACGSDDEPTPSAPTPSAPTPSSTTKPGTTNDSQDTKGSTDTGSQAVTTQKEQATTTTTTTTPTSTPAPVTGFVADENNVEPFAADESGGDIMQINKTGTGTGTTTTTNNTATSTVNPPLGGGAVVDNIINGVIGSAGDVTTGSTGGLEGLLSTLGGGSNTGLMSIASLLMGFIQ